MKHIYYNKNINVMHLFEEEMQTEKKRKRNVEGYKTRQSESQKLDVMVVEKALLEWPFCQLETQLKFTLYLQHYSVTTM